MSMAKSKKDKADKNIYAYYIEVVSPLDLAKQIFDYSLRHINTVKEKDSYKIFAPGEKFGDVRFVYYVNLEHIGKYLVYTPEAEPIERYTMVDRLPEQPDYRSYRSPIVELLATPYSETKDIKKAAKVIKVEVKDPHMLLKAMIGRLNEDLQPQKVYAFYSGGDHIIGTFEFFHESVKTFTYAKTEIKNIFNAIRYNYEKDSISTTNSFTEMSSSFYIRVINLKKPFPFF
jgi:hypothetical protein